MLICFSYFGKMWFLAAISLSLNLFAFYLTKVADIIIKKDSKKNGLK